MHSLCKVGVGSTKLLHQLVFRIVRGQMLKQDGSVYYLYISYHFIDHLNRHFAFAVGGYRLDQTDNKNTLTLDFLKK